VRHAIDHDRLLHHVLGLDRLAHHHRLARGLLNDVGGLETSGRRSSGEHGASVSLDGDGNTGVGL
jgi:hypothetical protein